MSDQNGSALGAQQGAANPADTSVSDKGKGKAPETAAPQDVNMGEEEEEDETSEEEVDEVSHLIA